MTQTLTEIHQAAKLFKQQRRLLAVGYDEKHKIQEREYTVNEKKEKIKSWLVV